jgi:hypothetical protein
MDYKYIRAWGKMMGSFKYYVDDQVERAIRDKAPEDAVYQRSDGRWVQLKECKQSTIDEVMALVKD